VRFWQNILSSSNCNGFVVRNHIYGSAPFRPLILPQGKIGLALIVLTQ